MNVDYDYSVFSVEIPQFRCRTCGGPAYHRPDDTSEWACPACMVHTSSAFIFFRDSEKDEEGSQREVPSS